MLIRCFLTSRHAPRALWLAPLLLAVLLLAGCGAGETATPAPVAQATEAAPPAATDAPAPTATAAATETVAATDTPAPTATPAATATPAPTATPEPSPTPEGLSEAQLAEIKPNELGWALVMEYHLIESGEDQTYNRTPESFRADLEWLYANHFYPVRFRDLAAGNLDIPLGKTPVVLTFDDSSDGQFRLLDDGSVDPTSAMGILLAFSEEHADFPPVATFFPLLDVDVPSRILWGQPDLIDQKLRMILDLGGEVGSHTVTHQRLDQVDEERIQWQLGESQHRLEERLGGTYEITSLSLPLGIYPSNEALIHSGAVDGVPYDYAAAAEVGGGASYSPYSSLFDPYHIARAQAAVGYIENVFRNLENRPTLLYVSDGDPDTITVPTEETLDPEHQGEFDETQWEGFEIVRYARPTATP